MPLRARVGRHARDGGRHCQNWPEDQRTVVELLNAIPAAAGGAGGGLKPRIVSGICSDDLYRAILAFEDKNFPGQHSGFLDPDGPMLKRMQELTKPAGPVDFVAPGDAATGFQYYRNGQAPQFPGGATRVVSGQKLIIDSNELKFLGVSGKGVASVTASAANAVTIEDGGTSSAGVHWWRISRPRGKQVVIQAKDAKGAVLASVTLDIIELPGGSGPIDLQVDPKNPKVLVSYDPKEDPDYIDKRMTGVGYEIYLKNGFVVYVSGMSTPIDVPDRLTDIVEKSAEPIDAKVYDTYAQANEAVRAASAKTKGHKYFAYYRGAGGAVIAPTVFSPASTPRTIATMWVAREMYVDYVQKSLSGVAIGIVGGMVFRAIIGRLTRATDEPEPPRFKPSQPNAPPAVARLRATAIDMQNKNPVRNAEVLTSPRTYRHTLTADNPLASYAQIESKGVLNLSSGAKAQYGEGVYAWPPGFQGARTYIDIEVPAGTGVETLEFGGGSSWVRMMPPEGDALSVKIVGTNLTKEQIEMGRMMIGGNDDL